MAQVAARKSRTLKNAIPVDDETVKATLVETNDAREIWLVMGVEGVVCRYGPYTPQEAADLIHKLNDQDIVNVTIVANMGSDFNLGLARRISDHIKRLPENTN